MTIINRIVVETLNIVAKGLQNEIRALNDGSTLIPGQTSTPTPSSSPSQTTSSDAGPTTSAPPTSSTPQSPLLFFVALGFGVVFTNLWIIVGVKYCFRYNARNRAIARGENPDEVQLDNVPPGRPHRRRREKKLMTMDEVNQRFPLTKYKNWAAARTQEGLPAAGGVDPGATPSRAASVRHAEGLVPSSPVDTKHSVERPDTAVSSDEAATVPVATRAPRLSTESNKRPNVAEDENKPAMATLTEVETTATNADVYGKDTRTSTTVDSEDEDAHIHDALPVDVLEHPGDACAICIETLEADDDVRGLTCGHAFHAGCLDPWLTSRRACCPLCKADYYVPKPKPEGQEGTEGETGRRRRGVQPPPPVQGHWAGIRGPRFLPRPMRSPWLPREVNASTASARTQRSERSRRVAEARATAVANASTTPEVTTEESTPAQGGFRRFVPNFRLPGRRQATETQTETQEPTPQQLEAGSPAVR